MAEAFLARRLVAAGAVARVRSAGLLRNGDPPPPEVVSVMAEYGIDVSGHRSRVAMAADLAAADLILTMSREQVRRAVVMDPDVWQRSFTLKELLRRGSLLGPRPPAEPLADWVKRAHAGRDRLTLLGDSLADDVADPYGGPPQGYSATAAELEALLTRLVRLCWPRPDLPAALSEPVAGSEDAARRDQG